MHCVLLFCFLLSDDKSLSSPSLDIISPLQGYPEGNSWGSFPFPPLSYLHPLPTPLTPHLDFDPALTRQSYTLTPMRRSSCPSECQVSLGAFWFFPASSTDQGQAPTTLVCPPGGAAYHTHGQQHFVSAQQGKTGLAWPGVKSPMGLFFFFFVGGQEVPVCLST